MNFIIFIFYCIILCNATKKRERDYGATITYTKKQLIAILASDKGYEDRRGKPVRFQAFTIHGTNDVTKDTMEHYEEKLGRLRRILERLLERQIIEGFLATIEYWDSDETRETRYINRFNYHIHFFIIAGFYFIKPQWYQFYRRIFGSILAGVDFTCESCFHMSSNEIYGIAYCIAYIYKRQEWYTPIFGGIINTIYIKDMLKQHRENPLETQVDHGKEHVPSIERYEDPTMITKGSLLLLTRFFYFHDIKWKRSNDVLTFIWDNSEFDYTHFCIVMSNCGVLKNYHIWLDSAFKRLKKPEYYLLKYKQV